MIKCNKPTRYYVYITNYLKYIEDKKWTVKLAYLSDIFSLLNGLNLQLQGKEMNCFAFMNKIDAFKKKMALWKSKSIALDFEMFPMVSVMVLQNVPLAKYIAKIIDYHLEKMIDQFEIYFPANKDPRQNNLWIANPFVNAEEPNTLTVAETAQLLGNYQGSKPRFFGEHAPKLSHRSCSEGRAAHLHISWSCSSPRAVPRNSKGEQLLLVEQFPKFRTRAAPLCQSSSQRTVL